MLDENALRRNGFRQGTTILLADGQAWTFPSPPEPDAVGEEGFDPGYAEVLAAIMESEDRSDLLRAELALAICLLGQNYELGPFEYRCLLRCPSDSPVLARMQQAFHQLALDHCRPLGSPSNTDPEGKNPERSRSRRHHDRHAEKDQGADRCHIADPIEVIRGSRA